MKFILFVLFWLLAHVVFKTINDVEQLEKKVKYLDDKLMADTCYHRIIPHKVIYLDKPHTK